LPNLIKFIDTRGTSWIINPFAIVAITTDDTKNSKVSTVVMLEETTMIIHQRDVEQIIMDWVEALGWVKE